jgi:hypothetical protein
MARIDEVDLHLRELAATDRIGLLGFLKFCFAHTGIGLTPQGV